MRIRATACLQAVLATRLANKQWHLSRQAPRGDRKGMALLVVVVLVMLISLGAYRFSFYMESQYRVTRTHEEQVHARLAAVSGLEVARAIVELPISQRTSLGGLENNESTFRDIAISEASTSLTGERDSNAWRVCLVSPLATESGPVASPTVSASLDRSPLFIRFGLENESAKLHIPTLLAWDRMKPGHARTTLLGLPGATEMVVDTWLRELGVAPLGKNGGTEKQLSNLDEVRQVWFGGDLNQNYQLDPLERRLLSQDLGNRSGQPIPENTQSNSMAFRPLQRYLTWHSGHRNLTQLGKPRINLNDPNLPTLHRNLLAIWPADRANFVIAMRQYGPGSGVPNATSQTASIPAPPAPPKSGTTTSPAPALPIPVPVPVPIPIPMPPPSTAPTAPRIPAASPVPAASQAEWVQNWSPDLSKNATYSFQSSLELIGAIVDLPPVVTSNAGSGGAGSATSAKRFVQSPFSSDTASARNYISTLLDEVTIDLSPALLGRVDASEAPLEVLAGVPGLDLTLAQQIVEHRLGAAKTTQASTESGTIAWLLDVMELTKLKELETYLTSRSDVYSVQSVGYRDNQSAVYRITATIDASVTPSQMRNLKVWQPWDRGFSIQQLVGAQP